MAKVNVLVPVYNGQDFIRETLERVLEQDYEDFDVLVCDNASTDYTVDEIKKVQDDRIRFFQNETNLGMGGNWNRLLSEADGEYIIFVCADDLLLPGALRKKADVLDRYPDVNLVFSASDIVNEKGKKIFTRRPYKGSQMFVGSEIQKKLFVEKNIFAEPTNNMLRRNATKQVGEFDTNLWYTIDWDYWIRMTNTGNVYYIDESMSGFRVSGSSATGTSTSERVLKDEEVFMQKYVTGDIIHITDEMIQKREKNYRNRMFMRNAFMKVLSLFS